MKELKKLLKDCFTGPSGHTYDPARVFGYPCAIAGVWVFLFASVHEVLTKDTFDYVAFSTGFAAMMGGLLLIAGSVAAKNFTEPKEKP